LTRWFACLLGASGFAACSAHGCSDETLAELTEAVGEVQRAPAPNAAQFTDAALHQRFLNGDGLRTLKNAQARLQLPASGTVLVQSDTTIRIWRGDARALRLKVSTGVASVVASSGDLGIQTELGIAVLQAGGQLRVRPGHKGQRYEVAMGRAILTTPEGRMVPLGTGEVIGVDKASEALEGRDRTAPQISDGSVPLPTEGTPEASNASDLRVTPGATLAIYDPDPPTEVAFDTSACPTGASLSLHGRPASPVDDEPLPLAAGTHDYQLTCLGNGAPSWRGTLRIVHNPGTAQLPRSAPHNSIDADGRTYTILFQNLLPILEVRWARAPAASHFTLVAQLASGRELRVPLTEPSHVFAAGALPEGRHTLRFEADRPGTPRSHPTTIDLRFDNASPSASIREPPVSGFAPGASVHVVGIALPGAQVSVLGQRFGLDTQQRFAGDVELPPGTRAIGVRIQHPRAGTRVYIRRARTAP
jgi:hypothetical protein